MKTLVIFLALVCMAAPAMGQTYEVCPDAVIPDSGNPDNGVLSVITVPECELVGSVVVCLNIAHTWSSDLEVTLSHGGVTVTLVQDQGGSGDWICENSVCFDDTGIPFPTSGGVPSGTYAPVTALAQFNSLSGVGDWELYVTDDAGGDLGTLCCWSLTLLCDPVSTEDASWGAVKALYR